MCGLVGAFAFADTPREELAGPVAELTDLIARRGPDDVGHWDDGRRCALGFRRLAILDLSAAGHQPMLSEDGRYAIVFNGEIYNFRELRAELEARGHRLRSSGDCAVLLAALREWGTEALSRASGMFALALYDTRERTLLLARDHAGIKPLFYAVTSRGVVFGSQYNQLVAHPWLADARVDRSALGLYLRFGFLPGGYGLHAGTGQIEAGAWVQFDARGVRRDGTFFDLGPDQPPTLRGEAAIEALDAALVRAVKRHLISDVPVGLWLSGGIDSPLVAAEATRSASSLQAFSIGVDDPRIDESADARRYASELGLELTARQLTESTVLESLDDVVAASTEPTADYSMFPTLAVSKLAREHVKVVLSGDGGDELYWGYPSRFSSAIELSRYFGWPRPARAVAIGARRLFGVGTANRDILRFDSIGRLYQRKHTLMPEATLRELVPELPAIPAGYRAFECDSSDPDYVARWIRWNELRVHLARVLAKVDRASMYHSLEVRVPLLDKEVIEVAWRTDWRTCLDLSSRVGKRPLRRALARRVAHQTTPKRGFTVPMHRWLVGPLRATVDDHLRGRRELLGQRFDAPAFERVSARLRAGDASLAWGVWLLLSLSLWERSHGQLRVGRARAEVVA